MRRTLAEVDKQLIDNIESFWLIITTYLSAIPAEISRREVPKGTFLAELQKSTSGEAVRDFDLLFENMEPFLRQTYVRDGWAIHYNVYTNRIIIERIPSADAIARNVELRDKYLRSELTKLMEGLTPSQYELFVGNLFANLPWIRTMRTTKRSHDGGIDLEGAYMDPNSRLELPVFAQVKKWGSRVDFPEMTKFIGALALRNWKKGLGIFVASGGFTKEANQAAEDAPNKILLYDGEKLLDMMIEQRIGIRRSKVEVSSPDEEFWSELLR
jgi:hypothetical protein